MSTASEAIVSNLELEGFTLDEIKERALWVRAHPVLAGFAVMVVIGYIGEIKKAIIVRAQEVVDECDRRLSDPVRVLGQG